MKIDFEITDQYNENKVLHVLKSNEVVRAIDKEA